MANRHHEEGRYFGSNRDQNPRAENWSDQRDRQHGQRQGRQDYGFYPDDGRGAQQDWQHDRPRRDERGSYGENYPGDPSENYRRGGGSGPGGYGQGGNQSYGRESGQPGQYRDESRDDFSRGDYDRGGFEGGRGHDRGWGDDRSSGYGYRSGASDQSSWNQHGSQSGRFGGEEENRSGQSHRGRGPKGYQRSDDRICEDVCDRLSDDHDVDASDIEVSVSNCEVTLSGEVESKRAKRHAEDCADSVSAVGHVQNNLRVKQAESNGNSQETGKLKSKQ